MTPTARPGAHRPGRSQAICSLQEVQELPRGLGPQESERVRTRKDDVGGRLLETLFFGRLNRDSNFLYKFHIHCEMSRRMVFALCHLSSE